MNRLSFLVAFAILIGSLSAQCTTTAAFAVPAGFSGCDGTVLSSSDRPVLGTNFTVQMTGRSSGSAWSLLLSPSAFQTLLPSPPYAANCYSYLGAGAVVVASGTVPGDLVVAPNIAIPNDPALCGTNFFVQFAATEVGTDRRSVSDLGIGLIGV